jgi:hypothetical protein
VGWVVKSDSHYYAYYLGKGVYYNPTPWLQLWGGLITVYQDRTDENSNTLELRPFGGVKFMGENSRRWRYYNWSRYEYRATETLDTDAWTTVHRVRNQTRLELPLVPAERAWTPRSWYLLADVEPIFRSDTDELDPLRLRVGIGYIAMRRLLVEIQYYAQYTHQDTGLAWTDNIFRLNFKIVTKAGIFGLLGGDID